MVLIFLTAPLAYLPTAALAAILVSSALGLFDFASLRRYYTVSRPEFWLSLVATLGGMTVGVLQGVLIAVGLALLKLLRMASRPHDVVLGLVQEKDDVYSAVEEEGGRSIPGLIIYRFDASLLFFNADYFKDRVRAIIQNANTKPRWFLFDVESVPVLDITGADALEELRAELAGLENCRGNRPRKGTVSRDARPKWRRGKNWQATYFPDGSCRRPSVPCKAAAHRAIRNGLTKGRSIGP